MTSQVQSPAAKAWHKFFSADLRWSKELQRLFGNKAGDIRYTKQGEGEPGSELNEAWLEFQRTGETWRSTVKETLLGPPQEMTQHEANRLIDSHIDQAVKCQDIRDKCRYESAEYWQWHDRAMSWHYKAEQLMPKSARTITTEDFS